MSKPLRILTVCTGNICRSPVAERLLQSGLDALQPGAFSVRSAGTGALVGEPMQPESAALISRMGGRADEFAARQLTPATLAGVDLVLTMAVHHRGLVLDIDPAMLRRTFTIREFSRITAELHSPQRQPTPFQGMTPELRRAARAVLSGQSAPDVLRNFESGSGSHVPPPSAGLPEGNALDRLRRAAEHATAVRAKLVSKNTGDSDVVDPYRKNEAAWQRMADQLLPAIDSIIAYSGGGRFEL